MGEVIAMDVAVALMRLRLVERALHDRGRWEMEYAGVRVPVTRIPREHCVSLVAHFPPLCYMEDPPDSVGILIDGDLVHTIGLAAPLDEDGCEVWLDLEINTGLVPSR